MTDLLKYTIEFPIHSSVNILYNRLSTPSGLSEWFANNVSVENDVYTFFWDRSEQSAKMLKKKENSFIRFKWEEEEYEDTYFEFLIQIDELTGDVSLMITDYAEDNTEQEEQTALWQAQFNNLKRALGS